MNCTVFLSRRLVGVAFGSLGFVHCFRARADDIRGIVIDCCVVSANSCGFDEFCFVECYVLCLCPNVADEVVCTFRFVVRDLEEERRHNLPDSCDFGVGRLDVYKFEFFDRIR